jgi:GTP 3',8-cyclase
MDSTYLSQTKIYSHLDRVDKWLRTGTCFPVTIEIDPTNTCIRHCKGCAGNRFNESQLSLAFMKKIIREIKPFCKGLIFTGGGEPLCNGNMLAAIEFAKKNGIDVALVTNADLLNKEAAEKIVRNCSYVRLSYNDEGVWDKISILVSARKKIKSSCTIGVGMLTNRKRRSLMRNFSLKAKAMKADYAQLRPFHLDTFDARAIIKKLQIELNDSNFKIIASEYKYENMKERRRRNKEYEICFADNFRTVIAADGRIFPDCWTRGMKDFCIGDLKKDSFRKIWKSGKRKRMLFSKLDKKNCPPMCYHDPLNELLWNVWKQNKVGEHSNFV